MIKFNDKDIKEIYIGDKAISEVYCGDKLVWSKKPKVLDWSKFFYGLERVDDRINTHRYEYHYKVNIDSSFKDISGVNIIVKLKAGNTLNEDQIEYTGQSSVTSPAYTNSNDFGYVKFTAIYNGKEVAKAAEYGRGYI